MGQCKLCNFKSDSKVKLSKHILHTHKLKKGEYLIQTQYNGVQPTCSCGCGTLLKYNAVLGDFPTYIKKHLHIIQKGKTQEEIFGDMNSPKRIKAISEARKKRFKSGEYDHILNYVSKKRSKDIIKKISKTKKKQWETGNIGKKKYRPSKLEKTFSNILDLLDIKYQGSFYAPPIKAFYDFYIPNTKILIEVDGDFWHTNPLKYPDGPKAKCQIKNQFRDQEKTQWAKENGYKLLRFWEYDINNNIKQVKQTLLENLK